MTQKAGGAGEADFARRSDLERWLMRAESSIALLERARPLNLASEQARCSSAWRAGRSLAPAFQYAPAPELFRAARGARRDRRGRSTPMAPGVRLYADRALELGLEARAAEVVGTPSSPSEPQRVFRRT